MSSQHEKRGSPPPYAGGEARPHTADGETPSKPPPAYDHNAAEGIPPVSDAKAPLPEPERLHNESPAGPSSSRAPLSPSASSPPSSSSNPLSKMKSAFMEKRQAKAAAKKVDYYEKMYGFVPKNVMTEAEWKSARDRAPKVKVPVDMSARSYFGPPRGQ